jgi:hypothetical protein
MANETKGPSRAELAKLRRDLNAATAGIFKKYGYRAMLVGPPGPRPPPKLEARVLNLFARG